LQALGLHILKKNWAPHYSVSAAYFGQVPPLKYALALTETSVGLTKFNVFKYRFVHVFTQAMFCTLLCFDAWEYFLLAFNVRSDLFGVYSAFTVGITLDELFRDFV